jgi:hypothetical protein
MRAANASLSHPASIHASTRTTVYPSRPMVSLLDELARERPDFPRTALGGTASRCSRPPAPAPKVEAGPGVKRERVWSPLGEPPVTGLGPSVAELTLGRPPRAPRPGDR